MSRFALIVFALVVVAVAFAPEAESGLLPNFGAKFFDNARVSRCGHTEIQLEGHVGLKEMNDPKPPCRRQCEKAGLVSLKGEEQVSFGPKVFCCCKAE